MSQPRVGHTRRAVHRVACVSVTLAVLAACSQDPTETGSAGTVAFAISGLPDLVLVGVPASILVTARDAAGHTVTGYTGTVHFISNDPLALLPPDYHFLASDHGSHGFQVTFGTAGRRFVSATDVDVAVTGMGTAIVTTTFALAISGLPDSVRVGAPASFQVIAQDAAGHTTKGYTGTVHFTSNDPLALVPPDYQFLASDSGSHGFQVTFGTAGLQSVGATDASSGVADRRTATAGSPSVSITPTAANLGVNSIQQFTATVAYDPSHAGVTWTLTGSGCVTPCGSLSANSSASGDAVTYAAPAHPGTVTVTATSVTDYTKSASATVKVTAVTMTPTGFVGVDLNTTQQFTATLANDPSNSGVTWTLTGAGCATDCGSLSANSSASGVAVTYTAPAIAPAPGTITLTATSVADTTWTASAVVVVTTPGVITVFVSPASASFSRGLVQPAGGRFTAYVFNDALNAGVTWSAGLGSVATRTSASGQSVLYLVTVPSGCNHTSVTARSVTDPTRFASAYVTLNPPMCGG